VSSDFKEILGLSKIMINNKRFPLNDDINEYRIVPNLRPGASFKLK